ncbi:MAG: hypothetical protein IPL79_12625 [Myxococcales bacterium]|nr:hypothetical protein [Myxococcales bacterium]
MSLALALPTLATAPREAHAEKMIIELSIHQKKLPPIIRTWTMPMPELPMADGTARSQDANIYFRRTEDVMTLEVDAPTVPMAARLKATLASLRKEPAVVEQTGVYRLQWRIVP